MLAGHASRITRRSRVAEVLSPEHRALVLARLAGIDCELGEISTWLTACAEDQAAIVLECAARDCAAAAWRLEQPYRPARPG
jgi:hypothetical protein